MAKFAMLAVLLAAIAVVQAFPSAATSDLSEAAARGDWDAFNRLFRDRANDMANWQPFSSGSVRSLRPPPGGHVFGTSEYSFRTSTNDNGKTSENSGGHRIINNDGKIEEFDFIP